MGGGNWHKNWQEGIFKNLETDKCEGDVYF